MEVNSIDALYIKFWMKKKSKHVSLTQQNGFGPAFLHMMHMMLC
jgi:hypothetical protein